MKRACEYCDSPLLPTDTVCWHCGRSQPITDLELSPSPATPSETDEEAAGQPLEPVGSPRALFYVVLTLIVIVALLLVTRSLGRSPTMVYGAGAPEGDWVSITAPDRSFSIEIPAAWEWQFADDRNAGPDLAGLSTNNIPLDLVVRPLADLVPDLSYRMVAQGEDSLLVVASSTRLNRLSPQQAAEALPVEEFTGLTIQQTDVVRGEMGEARAAVSLIHDEPALRCDQHLVPGATETYLVTACAEVDIYPARRAAFAQALASFATPAH